MLVIVDGVPPGDPADGAGNVAGQIDAVRGKRHCPFVCCCSAHPTRGQGTQVRKLIAACHSHLASCHGFVSGIHHRSLG